MEYNEEHNITPTTVIKGVRDIIEATKVQKKKKTMKMKLKRQLRKIFQ